MTAPGTLGVITRGVGDSKYSKLRANVSSELRSEKRLYTAMREEHFKNSSRPIR